MKIEDTKFGTITIDGKTYQHDVVIRLSGDIVKRKKKLSKKYYGTSHMLSKDEAKFAFEKGCEQFIVGSGQMGNVRLSPEADSYFAKRAVRFYRSRHRKRSVSSTNLMQKDRAFSRDVLTETHRSLTSLKRRDDYSRERDHERRI
jgi:hypothetical protein